MTRLEPASIRAITFDFGNTLVPVDRAGLRRVVEATGEAIVGRLGPFELEAFLAIWAEERARQFREEVPRFREVDLADRFVRVLARLRGMPPPPGRRAGIRPRRPGGRIRRKSAGRSTYTAPRSCGSFRPIHPSSGSSQDSPSTDP
jgi:hypothetical protein